MEVKKARIEQYIRSCHIMTLGSSAKNRSWTAPVFYVYCSGLFYFFSKQDSTHIQNSIQTGHASGSIHHNPEDWQDIRGIQMEGSIHPAKQNEHSARAFTRYLDRFPFIHKDMGLPSTSRLGWLREQFQVRWYCFRPQNMVYLDNSVHFAFKLKLGPDLEHSE